MKLETSKKHFKLHTGEFSRTEMLGVEPKRNIHGRVGVDARKYREWLRSRIRKDNVSGIATLLTLKVSCTFLSTNGCWEYISALIIDGWGSFHFILISLIIRI